MRHMSTIINLFGIRCGELMRRDDVYYIHQLIAEFSHSRVTFTFNVNIHRHLDYPRVVLAINFLLELWWN